MHYLSLALCLMINVPSYSDPTATVPSIIMASGSYFDGLHYRPLLALSQDAGNTWHYPDAITHAALPSPFKKGSLGGGVACDGPLCIACGHYNDNKKRRPLLALTQDEGRTWRYPADITTTSLPKPLTRGSLDGGISCSAKLCIATGTYHDGKIYRPLLALTQDAGATWSYPKEITDPKLISPMKNGNLNGHATCVNQTCLATGAYSDGIQIRPLLYCARAQS